jgi:hypothetical protein
MKSANAARLMQRYFRTYYHEVEATLAQYPPIPDPLPDAIRRPRRIEVAFTKDGIAIIVWDDPNGGDYSFHHRDYGGSLRQFAATLAKPPAYAGLSWEAPPWFPGPGVTVGKVQLSVLAEVVTDLGSGTVVPGLSWSSPWRSIQVLAGFDPVDWRADRAILQAQNNVLQFVTAHLMQQTAIPAEQQPEKRDVAAKLQDAVDGFRGLLDSNPQRESDIHRCLLEHEALLTLAIGASEVRSEVPLGSEYRVDFALRITEQRYILIEIEAAQRRLFTQSGDPASDLTHALRQVRDWRDWIGEQLTYARTVLPGIIDPECWVLIGRRNSLTNRDQKALQRMNLDEIRVTIMTYDDLVDSAARQLDNIRRL